MAGAAVMVVALVSAQSLAQNKSGRYRVLVSPELASASEVEGYLNEIADRGWIPINISIRAFKRRTSGKLEGDSIYQVTSGGGDLLVLRR